MLSRYGDNQGKFPPEVILGKIEDFEEIAASRVSNAPTGRFLIAMGIFGGLVIPCGLPAAGAIALPFIVNAVKSAMKNGRQAEYIAKSRNFCHLLTHSEIAQLIRFTGKEFIAEQCVQAHIDGMKLTHAARELVELADAPLTPSTFAEVKKALTQPQAEREGWAPLPADPDAPAMRRNIGANTRLGGAIPVTATTVNPVPAPISYLIGGASAHAERARLRTVLIAAVSGGGKDMLLSNAVRVFLGMQPTFSVIVMDCKDDPKEYGYFADLPRVTVYRLNLATASESTAQAWIDAALDEFNARPEKVLLICNEGTLVREKSKRYVDAIAALNSSGDSRQKYAWEAGHSGHTDDLKINAAARSRFRPMVIAMSGEEMQVEAVLRAKWLADSANDMTAVRSEMTRSPVGRAWSDGQRWYTMPELLNHAGYDRDSRTFSQSREPNAAPAAPEPAAQSSLFSELAAEYQALNDESVPLMADFIQWLAGKRGEIITTRNAVLLWGNKRGRSVTRVETINAYLAEAIALGLLIKTPDGFRVL